MKGTISVITSKNLSFSKQIVKYLPQAVASRLPAEISVVAVSEKESRRLNRRYRGKNKPANVLSFLYTSMSLSSPRKRGSREQKTGFPIESGMTQNGKAVYIYGEIIVCPAVIRREAKAQKHSFDYQMTWMILHGMIHLAGVHHERSQLTTERVEILEKNILQRFFAKKTS